MNWPENAIGALICTTGIFRKHSQMFAMSTTLILLLLFAGFAGFASTRCAFACVGFEGFGGWPEGAFTFFEGRR